MDNPLQASTPATRLARAMGDRSAANVARASRMSLGRVKRLASGKSRFMVEDCEQLAPTLGVDPCWLAFGTGAK